MSGQGQVKGRPQRILNKYEGILMKDQDQSQVTKGHYKIRAQICRATHVVWVILHVDIDGDSNLTLLRHPN